jgi:hypothetical protein
MPRDRVVQKTASCKDRRSTMPNRFSDMHTTGPLLEETLHEDGHTGDPLQTDLLVSTFKAAGD